MEEKKGQQIKEEKKGKACLTKKYFFNFSRLEK